MAKVFTIAPGLENLGAMKTGGQGSVYKGRRTGEIISAIKLLPTPIHSEIENDKNLRDFVNEVEKLKRVNKEPNPNVVKIISSGLSETGNFPFIEMEYIDGPDLEELLQPPHDPVFRMSEVVKVATQLANALAHCHKNEIKHGDVKSNNVKYNIHSGNYVLLDFGLAVMTDEDRRTSLRQAGAIEFMAPELNEGQVLFQTDVYGYGIILFELLAGKVPFPLLDKSESARNVTRLQHIEAPLPDLLKLRAEHMPNHWNGDMKSREMQVPLWLQKLVSKCLEKKPGNRFANGMAIAEYIAYYSVHPISEKIPSPANVEYERMVQQFKQALLEKEKEIQSLKNQSRPFLAKSATEKEPGLRSSKSKGISPYLFYWVLLLAAGMAFYIAYPYVSRLWVPNDLASKTDAVVSTMDSVNSILPDPDTPRRKADLRKPVSKDTLKRTLTPLPTIQDAEKKDVADPDFINDKTPVTTDPIRSTAIKYKVAVDKAYFYSFPDDLTRRKAYMVPSDNSLLEPENEENGFIFISFTNQYGQTSKGWLKKSDLVKVAE